MKSSSARTLIFLVLIIIAAAIFVHAVTMEYTKPEAVPVPVISQESSSTLININTADRETLMLLPHIGEAKAQHIIDFRTKNGAFVTVNDLMRVDGIGEKLYSQIKDLITV